MASEDVNLQCSPFSTNSSDNHTVLICSPAQGVESSGVEVHTTVTTRSTTSQGSDFQHNTARSQPRRAAREQRRCRNLGASAVAGPQWVRPGRPSPVSVHARPSLGLRRPRSHGPGAAAQLPAPTACRRGLLKRPASSRPVARRPRATHAKPRLGAQAATWLRGTTAGKEPRDRRLRLQLRDGSTKSLADVEGGGETRKDAATDPVRRPREAKPSPFCGCALEGCAVFPLPFSGVVSVSERASIIVFFPVSSLWSLNSSQELKLVQKRNRSPADSLLVLNYNKLGN